MSHHIFLLSICLEISLATSPSLSCGLWMLSLFLSRLPSFLFSVVKSKIFFGDGNFRFFSSHFPRILKNSVLPVPEKYFWTLYRNFTSNKSNVDLLDIFRCRFLTRRRCNRLKHANLQSDAGASTAPRPCRSVLGSFRWPPQVSPTGAKLFSFRPISGQKI